MPDLPCCNRCWDSQARYCSNPRRQGCPRRRYGHPRHRRRSRRRSWPRNRLPRRRLPSQHLTCRLGFHHPHHRPACRRDFRPRARSPRSSTVPPPSQRPRHRLETAMAASHHYCKLPVRTSRAAESRRPRARATKKPREAESGRWAPARCSAFFRISFQDSPVVRRVALSRRDGLPPLLFHLHAGVRQSKMRLPGHPGQ